MKHSSSCSLVESLYHGSLPETHHLGAYEVIEGLLDPNLLEVSPVAAALEYSALDFQMTVVVSSSSSSFYFWLQHLEDPSTSCPEDQKHIPSCHHLCWLLVGHLPVSMMPLGEQVYLAVELDLQLTIEMHQNQNQMTYQLFGLLSQTLPRIIIIIRDLSLMVKRHANMLLCLLSCYFAITLNHSSTLCT